MSEKKKEIVGSRRPCLFEETMAFEYFGVRDELGELAFSFVF